MEEHCRMVDGLEVWRQQEITLLDMTNTVDYDQEAYAQLLEEMVREKQRGAGRSCSIRPELSGEC